MDTNRPHTSPSFTGLGMVQIALVTLGLLALLAWWKTALEAPSPAEWQRDWYKIWTTGRAFLDGTREGLYTTDYVANPTGYFWLYPPYALYLAAALALMPAGVAYMVLTAAICATCGVAAWVLAGESPRGREDAATMLLVFFASASFNAVVVTGQNSAWWLAFLLAGVLALNRDRDLLAAVCFAGWGFKPNWVAFLVLWLAVTRRWRVLAAVAACGGLMVASSLPLGPGPWWEFLESSRGLSVQLVTTFDVYKLVSLHAALRGLVPASWVAPVWIVSDAVLFLAAASVWWRTSDLLRQVGVLVLLVLGANVYAVFYDSLLLVVPAMAWWGRRDRYPAAYNAVIGGCLAAVWLWLWVSLYGVIADPPSLVGGFLAVWLIAEALATPHLEPTEPA